MSAERVITYPEWLESQARIAQLERQRNRLVELLQRASYDLRPWQSDWFDSEGLRDPATDDLLVDIQNALGWLESHP